MTHIDRVLGICLIHATGTTPGLLGSLKDKVLAIINSVIVVVVVVYRGTTVHHHELRPSEGPLLNT